MSRYRLGFRNTLSLSRFLSSPIIIRVPFFLLFGCNIREPKNKKGKRVLLRNLVIWGEGMVLG